MHQTKRLKTACASSRLVLCADSTSQGGTISTTHHEHGCDNGNT
ncbi:hypothetical protein BFJ63_vAg5067 [Fusarium oxysporum f. sp. narcissi]|uniref:Uncharacterized protein n=3 Tax=Fusarium oxysporum TaxID=5507 RepID=A0A420QJP4_FUSOX|nr:hypothetical protein BFJ65_g8197 [Fusarium oxysporum f. sp. cepae]RKK97389.1 hypothetical protein BFJ71_g7274 [Fusarium oxysporum]RYC92139.1 hypothetical protein BFJ63_vAg5067 [Fusarium oxysporum f. sp. narcissi]RKK53056.1 hypothetical protein BFJ67_g5331 [Fusarium oxysporum f. sp. cepae]RKK54057.1 hypothetical protein BFJ66_g4816 [Fusarium oxysporum f. sp. cepae]